MLNQSVQVRTALERAWNISTWPEAAVEKLFRHVEVRTYEDGERVLAAGAPLDAVWIVVEGAFLLSKTWTNGRRFLYGLLKPGELTGINSVFDGLPVAFDVTARGAARVLVVPGHAVRKIARTFPSVAIEIISYLCRSARVDNEALEIHSLNSVRRRIAKCILWIARGQAETAGRETVIDSKFSQEDVADMVCAARQSVNKEIRELIRQGILRQRYRTLVILDRDRLLRIATDEGVQTRASRATGKSVRDALLVGVE